MKAVEVLLVSFSPRGGVCDKGIPFGPKLCQPVEWRIQVKCFLYFSMQPFSVFLCSTGLLQVLKCTPELSGSHQ